MYEDADTEWLALFAQPMFIPQTKPAARIVTCHGDLKRGEHDHFGQEFGGNRGK